MMILLALLVSLAAGQGPIIPGAGLCSTTDGLAPAFDFTPAGSLIGAPNLNAFNPDFADGAWMGTGIPNAPWATDVDTTNQYQLGLAVGPRFGTPLTADADGRATLAPAATLSVYWSFRIYGDDVTGATTAASQAGILDTLQQVIDNGGRFELGIDLDPTDDTNFFVIDPISALARTPPAGAYTPQGYFLDGPNEDGVTVSSNTAEAVVGLGSSPAVQNVFSPAFLQAIGLDGAAFLTGTPDVTDGFRTLPDNGRFEVYFAYSVAGVEELRVAFSVLKGSPAAVPGGFSTTLTPLQLAQQQCGAFTE